MIDPVLDHSTQQHAVKRRQPTFVVLNSFLQITIYIFNILFSRSKRDQNSSVRDIVTKRPRHHKR